MKKDEAPSVNIVKDRGNCKYESKIQGQKTQLTKPFLGCNTCKLKNNVPMKKPRAVNENYGKVRKNEDNYGVQNVKIKLTDLCDEDKKRIVELMEELSKYAERNRNMKELLEQAEKAKQEQNECLVKQTNLHLEEKNIFLKEIQTYKTRLEAYEMEMKEKLKKWESREKFMDKKIRCFAKALKKSMSEKSDLLKEISHLKTCLKQSLESFELLRNEVAALQRLSLSTTKTSEVPRCLVVSEDKKEIVPRPEEPLESVLPAAKDTVPDKNSLDVINMKLEQLYALLQNRSIVGEKCSQIVNKISSLDELKTAEEVEVDKMEKERFTTDVPTEMEENKKQNELKQNAARRHVYDAKTNDTSYKFLKPFSEYNKTSIQAERILKNIEKPFCFEIGDVLGRDEKEDQDPGRRIQSEKHLISYNEFAKKSEIDRKNECFDEERLLSELFYSNVADAGLEAVLFSVSTHKFCQPNVYSNN